MAWCANLLWAWVPIGVATYGSVPRDFNLLMAGLVFYSAANPRLFLARRFASYSVTRGKESARTGHRTPLDNMHPTLRLQWVVWPGLLSVTFSRLLLMAFSVALLSRRVLGISLTISKILPQAGISLANRNE